jgi:hypothetical protein
LQTGPLQQAHQRRHREPVAMHDGGAAAQAHQAEGVLTVAARLADRIGDWTGYRWYPTPSILVTARRPNV